MNSANSRSRLYAAIIMSFPIALAFGITLIPVVTDYGDHTLAEEAVRDSTRWYLGHILTAMAFGLGVLACSCIGDVLYRMGQRKRVMIALPLVAVGGSLHAAGLGADGIGPIAVVEGGESARLFFDGSSDLVPMIFVAAAVVFGLGLIALMFGVSRTNLLKGIWKVIVPTASILFVGLEALPSGWGLYGIAALCFLVFAPLSLALRRGVLLP
ncbi:MAG: hypothetical protein KDD67_03915 [Ignavibacteriae bacterium]|nr:hypothetical protein [Ignavibacteriota bacterium]MCB9215011.1 hypothetical protein [Ignavibacteria bacterium]